MSNCMPDHKKLSNKVVQFSYLFDFFPEKKKKKREGGKGEKLEDK